MKTQSALILPAFFYMSTFDQDAIDLQREQAEAAAAAAKGEDAPGEEEGAPLRCREPTPLPFWHASC